MDWDVLVIDVDWGKPPDAAIEIPPGVIQGYLGLQRKMSFMNTKIKQFSSSLYSLPVGDLKDLSANEIVARIEQLFMSESQKEIPSRSFSHRGSFTQK